MNPVHSHTGASIDPPNDTEGVEDAVASLLDEHTTPLVLDTATSDELLFAISVVLLMNEAHETEDRLRRRSNTRSLFATHSRSRQLGALFQAALRDETTAAQAVTFMNTERVTWSVLVEHVRIHNLTPNGAEATVEDVIHWLAQHPCGVGALHEAVRLGLSDEARSHTPEWLDDAWKHIVQKDLLREAIERANARNLAMLAERYAELADDEDILGLFRQGAHLGKSAQTVFFKRLKNAGMLAEVVKQSTTILEAEEVCHMLETTELEEIEKLVLHNLYFQQCVRRELQRRA
jgi:hypothetical protein